MAQVLLLYILKVGSYTLLSNKIIVMIIPDTPTSTKATLEAGISGSGSGVSGSGVSGSGVSGSVVSGIGIFGSGVSGSGVSGSGISGIGISGSGVSGSGVSGSGVSGIGISGSGVSGSGVSGSGGNSEEIQTSYNSVVITTSTTATSGPTSTSSTESVSRSETAPYSTTSGNTALTMTIVETSGEISSATYANATLSLASSSTKVTVSPQATPSSMAVTAPTTRLRTSTTPAPFPSTSDTIEISTMYTPDIQIAPSTMIMSTATNSNSAVSRRGMAVPTSPSIIIYSITSNNMEPTSSFSAETTVLNSGLSSSIGIIVSTSKW